MKTNNRSGHTLLSIILVVALSACASKKNVVTDTVYNPSDSRAAIIADALGKYTDWTSARVNGKLKESSLPVNPSLKIYMKRGTDLTLSASAVFVGEVFRLELTKDSLFIVNKLKKEYCKESGEKLKEIYPTLCEELQSLLLGRMIVPGSGPLSESNISKVEITMENEMRKVAPSLGDLPIAPSAFYMLDSQGRITDLVVEGESGRRIFAMDYDWKGDGGVDLTAVVSKKGKPMEIEIDLDKPQWGAQPLSPFKLGGGYKRVSLKDFLKSVGMGVK
ncbi:MAG: DUF4292 domain-containing protein [Muribaculaceae bacterium]|nr:DUF4292 domain-containing protein [Muribaculaceae bacterium]